MSSRGSANPRASAASTTSQAFDSLSPFLFTANADYAAGKSARGSSSVVAPFLGAPNQPPTTSSAASPSKASQKSSHQAVGSADAHEASSGRAFNFQEFLEKMRQPSAFDIVKTIKQFVLENETKVTTPEEAMHIVGNFLANLADSFRTHELWKGASEDDLDNASEGLEKYVMSKMYRVYFQPRLSDDGVKDEILRDRIKLLSFLEPQHLDIEAKCCRPDLFDSAAAELVKMDSYKAPRDKIICILNAAKLLTKVLQDAHCDGADAFLPVLIYATLRANPPRLYSNLQFIHRFRSPSKLTGEAGYYLTHMFGAVTFIERLEASQLSIDPLAFEAGLSRTIQAHPASVAAGPSGAATATGGLGDTVTLLPAPSAPHAGQPQLPAHMHAPSKPSSGASPAPSAGGPASADMSLAASLLDLSANPNTNPPPILSSSGHDLALLDPFSAVTPPQPSPRTASAQSTEPRAASDLAGIQMPSAHMRFSMLAQPPTATAAAAPAPPAAHGDSFADFGAFSSSPAPPATAPAHAAQTQAATSSRAASGLQAGPTSSLSSASSRGSPIQQYGAAATTHTASTLSASASAATLRPANSSPSPSASSRQAPSSAHNAQAATSLAHAPRHGSADPFLEGGIQQLLAAVSEPPVAKFLQCTIEELGMADVPLLLADYKRLAALNDSLARTLRLNVSV